jgi:glycosyltransferase involved in cell wall biosynthesis
MIRERGHRVIVCCKEVPNSNFQGVETTSLFAGRKMRELVEQADLVCSHLEFSELAAYLARKCRKPLIHFVHNSFGRPALLSCPENQSNQYIVYNSQWIKEVSPFPQPSMVAYPPVDWRNYQVVTNNRYITLINVSEAKGGKVLAELALRMPDRAFLGVKGFRCEMVVEGLPNLCYLENTPEIRSVYSQTSVLIMPSDYESWGRVGVEAMASGLPVIAHPTPGLKESLSYAWLFCDRGRIEDWVEMIRALDNSDFRRQVSARCIQRSRELDPARKLAEFVQFLDGILAKQSAAVCWE